MDERELRRRRAAKRKRAIRKRRILIGCMLGALLLIIALTAAIIKIFGKDSSDALSKMEEQLSA